MCIQAQAAMVSDASKKKAASKKAAAAEKRGSKSAAIVAQTKLKDLENGTGADALADELAAAAITDRTCTGVLASHPQSRDIHVRIYKSCCMLRWMWNFSTDNRFTIHLEALCSGHVFLPIGVPNLQCRVTVSRSLTPEVLA